MSLEQTDTSAYEQLMNAIIEQAQAAMGDQEAIAMAEEVDKLELSNGVVDVVHGDPMSVTESLAQVYIDHLGMASKVALKGVASDYADDVELPDNIS